MKNEYPDNPFKFFDEWYQEAQKLDIKEPTAMHLATANKQGQPSMRVILLKDYDERGFCFYTNLNSRKASELKENPNAALCFYWMSLGKQIRIEGKVEEVSKEESDNYFASRRRGSQIGAWASKQSSIMVNESDLPGRVKEFHDKFLGQDVKRPDFWGGYRLIPSRIEFWQEGEYRLHKRVVYQRDLHRHTDWQTELLYP